MKNKHKFKAKSSETDKFYFPLKLLHGVGNEARPGSQTCVVAHAVLRFSLRMGLFFSLCLPRGDSLIARREVLAGCFCSIPLK